MLTAGFSKVCISPPVGSPLAGFAARKGVSEGIHDHIFVRALVLENGSACIALVSVDVLALSSEFVGRVRDAIHKEVGIRQDSVMIASTHTHSAPVTIRTFFNPEESLDQTYMNSLADAITECVRTARRGRVTARVGIGTGRVEGIGVNRRTPDMRPVDEEIGIIKVEDEGGRVRGVLLNYACHPTVLGSNNLLVTGDFPNFTIERIEESIGSDGFAMFVNGTQGNISMGHSSELSAIGVITPGRTFERATELGHTLADATLAALPNIETNDALTLGAHNMRANLPLKDYPPLEETIKNLGEAEEQLASLVAKGSPLEQLMPAQTNRLYASITNFYAREAMALPDGHLPIELQGVRIGETVFIAIPAEVFVETGLKIKRLAPHKTFIVGIANGYIGYLPTREAYEVGGYEVVSAKCTEEAEEILIKKAIELEEKLFATHAESAG